MSSFLFGSNIDDIRAEIMRLENEPIFDQRAWAAVLGQLSNSPCRRQDAVRRMMTAKQNAAVILEQPAQNSLMIQSLAICDVSAETVEA